MSSNGGSAFPGVTYISTNGEKNPEGMTLRDYFAAKALLVFYQDLDGDESKHPDAIAYWCYLMADAMLKAREK